MTATTPFLKGSPALRYWNMARQRYCRRLARYRNTRSVSADLVAKPAPAHPRGKPGFSTFESGCGRETDSPLEGAGFEPSVPLVRPVPEWLEKGARALCAWSAEMRAHP